MRILAYWRSFFLYILAGFVLFPFHAFSASLYFEPKETVVLPEQKFSVTVYLDSPEGVNALGGTLVYPSNIRLLQLHSGNSIVDMWVERPKEIENGAIRFAGIIPGGFYGVQGELFTATFMAEQESEITVFFDDIEMYRNTGDAVQAEVAASDLQVIAMNDGDSENTSVDNAVDTGPPGPFEIHVLSKETAFDGKNVLVFRAVDKGSGIAAYYIARAPKKVSDLSVLEWREAESPYPLDTDEGYVYVKAVDHFGNEQVAAVSLSAELYPHRRFISFALWAILFVIAGVFIIRSFRRSADRVRSEEYNNVE